MHDNTTAFFNFGQDPQPARSELNGDKIGGQPIRDANASSNNDVSSESVTNVAPTEVSERESFIKRRLVPMRVSFSRTRYFIPTPEKSWFSTGGPSWCTVCNEPLRFVFVTGEEAKTSTAGSYQTPKYIRCACFGPAETTRAPILLAEFPTTTLSDQPAQTSELIKDKPEIVPPDEAVPQQTVAAEITTAVEHDAEAAFNEKFENWLQKQKTKSETGEE
jgi:hypothetical protein